MDGPAQPSPDMPWVQLRTHLATAPRQVAIAFEQRIETLYATGRLDELWREVSGSTLLADALADASVAAPALRVVGAMAWRRPDADRAFAFLRLLPARLGLAQQVGLVEHEIALARRFLRIRAAGALTVRTTTGAALDCADALSRIFGEHVLVGSGARPRAWLDLGALLPDRGQLLQPCDAISERDPSFALAMIARLVPEVPPGRRTLPALSASDNWPRDYAHARPAMARELADLGVPLSVAMDSLESSRWMQHRTMLQRDVALQLFGLLVTILHATAQPEPAPPTSPFR